jgi:hypothetical protein
MFNLLILFPKYLYECKMSMVRRHVIQHLIKEHNAILTGQGWEDWQDNLSLQENIDQCCMNKPDFILAYKPLGCKGVEPIQEVRNCSVPMCLTYNECWNDVDTRAEIYDTQADLVVCHHINDLRRLGSLRINSPHKDVRERWVFHIPHCAKPELFNRFNKPWNDREILVLLTGTLSPEFYPLRCRLNRLIQSNKIQAQVLKHPGTRLKNLEACTRQEERYAEMLGNTKISLVCSSKYKYGLAKYIESWMAGCYVIGDLPPEFETHFSDSIGVITPEMTDEQIITMIQVALDNERQSTQNAVLHTNQLASEYYSTEIYCERLVFMMKDYLRSNPTI